MNTDQRHLGLAPISDRPEPKPADGRVRFPDREITHKGGLEISITPEFKQTEPADPDKPPLTPKEKRDEKYEKVREEALHRRLLMLEHARDLALAEFPVAVGDRIENEVMDIVNTGRTVESLDSKSIEKVKEKIMPALSPVKVDGRLNSQTWNRTDQIIIDCLRELDRISKPNTYFWSAEEIRTPMLRAGYNKTLKTHISLHAGLVKHSNKTKPPTKMNLLNLWNSGVRAKIEFRKQIWIYDPALDRTKP